MATTVRLQLKFGTMSGEKTWTFSRVDNEVTAAAVKGLMNAMIDNGSIYRYPPLSKVSATKSVTTETTFDVSD